MDATGHIDHLKALLGQEVGHLLAARTVVAQASHGA
jgi:hypothetical protein